VTGFAIGDRVMCSARQAIAEYAVIFLITFSKTGMGRSLQLMSA
jgi:hypothetical protein